MFAEATKPPSHPAQGSSRLNRAGAESPQTPRRRKNSFASRYRNFCRRYRRELNPAFTQKEINQGRTLIAKFESKILVKRIANRRLSSFLLSTPKRKEAKEKASKLANRNFLLSPIGGFGGTPPTNEAICWEYRFDWGRRRISTRVDGAPNFFKIEINQ